jgi:hypothetical protein
MHPPTAMRPTYRNILQLLEPAGRHRSESSRYQETREAQPNLLTR